MDSFQRSNYSIFNKTKKHLDPSRRSEKNKSNHKIDSNPPIKQNNNTSSAQPISKDLPQKSHTPNLELNVETSPTPQQKTEPIFKTNLFGDDKKRKQQILKTILWLFGALLVAIFFFSVGYYLKSRSNNLPQSDQSAEEISLGQVLYEKFGSDSEEVTTGSVRFEFWFDTNNDGERSNWETSRDSVGLNIRRKGEEIPFSSFETDGEGVIKINGLDDGEFEVTYYVIPNYLDQNYNENKHFYGQKYYDIISATDNSTGLLPTKWQDLEIDPDGSIIAIGLREYKPRKLVAIQSRQLVLYDPEKNIRFSSSSIGSSNNFPKKFEIRNNSIFYVKDGTFYKYNPLTGYGGASEKIYDQIVAPDDSYYVISPSGKSIVYGGHDGAYFQTTDDTCGRQMLRFNNDPIKMHNSSYPYDAIAARFQNDTHALIYGRVGSEQNRFFTASCDGNTLTIKKLPIMPRGFYGGGYVAHDRIVFKGPFSHEEPCDPGDTEPFQTCTATAYSDGLFIYDLASEELKQIGEMEFNSFSFDNFSYDEKYIFMSQNDGLVKVLNFSNKEETKILDINLKSQFKNYKGFSIRDTTVTYIGNDTFQFANDYDQCGKQKDCATVKQFTINGDSISPIEEVITIQDMLPNRLIGEITQ